MSPDEEIDLIDRARAAILEQLGGGGEGFADWIRRTAPHEPPPPHLQPLISVIERARFARQKILLSMPPGHAKTVTILRAIAWWLASAPADTCAYLSYSDRQAWAKSKLCHNLAKETTVPVEALPADPEFPEDEDPPAEAEAEAAPTEAPAFDLDPEIASAAEWRTKQGGGLMSAGVGGRLTGNRVTGFAVVDDPYKDLRHASSPAVRERVWSWFTSAVLTRLQDASVIVVHTRWHPDDLIGRLEKTGEWTVINLPAIAENDRDVLGRKPGEALWPEMYPDADLDRIRRDVGDFVWAGLYQGQPRLPGSKIFRDPARFLLRDFDPTGCVFVIGVDPAASKKTSADWSVAVKMAMKQRPGDLPLFWVTARLRRQVTVPTYAKELRAFQVTEGGVEVVVEAVGAFKAVPDLLTENEGALEVSEVQPLGDKFQRAQPLAGAWNDGRVLVPLDAPWAEEYIHEHKEFTGLDGQTDDQVDASSTAYNHLKMKPPPPQMRNVGSLGRRRV